MDKGFEHERVDPAVIFHGLPTALAAQRTEQAFSMDHLTYGGWFAEGVWTIRGEDHRRRAKIDPGRTLADLAEDLAEIGY